MNLHADNEEHSPNVIPMPARASDPASNYRERNSTADRALDILLMFNENRTALAASEVAGHLSVARSTAYRYLQSLVQTGFIEEQPGSGFRLGPRILELARLARRAGGLSEIATPIMRRLADTTGETVLLTRLAGTSVLCLERAEASERAVRISYERGQILPTNAGASAHVLLAWLADSDLDKILAATQFTRFTDQTIVTPEQLRQRLADTRTQGFAISRGELDPDILGIAAPIHGNDDKTVAGISVAALVTRVPDTELSRIVDQVRSAAHEISDRLKLLHD